MVLDNKTQQIALRLLPSPPFFAPRTRWLLPPMDSYESSDILGSNTLPVRDPGSAKWSGFSKTVFFLALLLAAYVGAVRAWAALLKWREKSYRL